MISQEDSYRITVIFPRDGVDISYDEANKEITDLFPNAPEKVYTLITFKLKTGKKVRVEGYGWPYHNVDEPEMEKWLNENEPIFSGITLRDFFNGDRFALVYTENPELTKKKFNESNLPEPFKYPYGTEHSYDLARYYDPLPEANKDARRFRAALL